MPIRGTAKSLTIPPPVLGWNSKDPISQMDQQYAVEAENFFSNGGTVDLRRGCTMFAKNITDSLPQTDITSSLAELCLQSGTRKLLAIAENSGYPFNVTSGGSSPVNLSSAGSRAVNKFATFAQYRNKLFIKDQCATPTYYWDGTSASVTAAAFTGPSGADTLLANPMPYKNRLYFTSNDGSIWFSDINAITGALVQYDMQSLLTQGGSLRFVGGLTKTGDDSSNYLCVISETGEALVYGGDSPIASNWGLVGHYYMAAPVGYRSCFYWGSNLVVITYQGLILMSDVLKGDQTPVYLTDKINDQFVATINASATDFVTGIFYPKGNMLIINIPLAGSSRVQFVMNTITGSWWKWTGLKASCWSLFSNDLYFGSTTTTAGGKVFLAWTGFYDEDPENDGAALARSIKLRPAYNYFGDTETRKQFTMAIPTMYQSQGMQLTMDADVDFANVAAAQVVTPDNADNTYKIYQPKVGLGAIGKCASIRIDQSVTTKQMSLQAIDVQWLEGDI